MRFKITLNKPAFEKYFEGQDVGGIEVDISEKVLQFRPVAEASGRNIIATTERARGGIQTVDIEGSETEALFKALSNPLGYPFFMIKRSATRPGWIEAEPWAGPKKITGTKALKSVEPERLVPHLRVWVRSGPRKLLDGDENLAETTESFVSLQPGAEDAVRARLRDLADALLDVDSLTMGRALAKLVRLDGMVQGLLPDLKRVAKAEAQNLSAKPEWSPTMADDAPAAVSEPEPTPAEASATKRVATQARFPRAGGRGILPIRRMRVFETAQGA